jgi:pimeloyl-[acyl-carrier protein] methyl ester esterase
MWCFQSDPLSLENGLKALINTDLRAKLDKVKTPTLIVHGSEDAVCNVECGRYLAANIPGAKLAIIDGAGHAPFVTRAEEFQKIVTEFTEKI